MLKNQIPGLNVAVWTSSWLSDDNKLQELSDTLPDTGENKNFEVAVKKLTDYFVPKQSTDFEIYKFKHTVPKGKP